MRWGEIAAGCRIVLGSVPLFCPGSSFNENLTLRSLGGIPDAVKTEKRKGAARLLQLVQRRAGLSRRKAQELIEVGEVELNGSVSRDPFLSLEEGALQSLKLRGQPLPLLPPQPRVYRYYKPVGQLCTHDDPHSGNTLGRVLRAEGFIGYSWAGRLDQDAEGLVVVTNDGELLHRLTHPRYRVKKIYHVWLASTPSSQQIKPIFADMRRGVEEGGQTLRILDGRLGGRPARAIVTLAEGRKREIKHLFAHFGMDVVRLKRVAIGPVQLAGLAPGSIARITGQELEQLDRFAERFSSHSGHSVVET